MDEHPMIISIADIESYFFLIRELMAPRAKTRRRIGLECDFLRFHFSASS